MPVSFYSLVAIILFSFLVTLIPFVGLPLSLGRSLTAIFGAFILILSLHSFYRGYIRILARMKRREKYEEAEGGQS